MSNSWVLELEHKVEELSHSRGTDSPELADAMMELANAHYSANQLIEAERFFWQVLNIRRKVLGEWHKSVAQVLSSLGEVYESYEQYEVAERFYRWSLTIVETALGKKHGEVAVAMESLARVLRHQERNFEAAELEAAAESIWYMSPNT